MNKKAEAFQEYLEEQGITCFVVDEIAGDQLNTVVFRSQIDVEGQSLPTLVILDSSLYGIIRVKLGDHLLQAGKELELLRQVNAWNSQYKIFKYYFDEEGTLFLDTHILNQQGQVDGAGICILLQLLVQHLTKSYKALMQSVWS